ncbi:MAG: alpha/beta hydrolase [Candidatus Aminicenantes bacterium]|nr:alpha/beta hydrolase [Candidatus Aminicenantes bacterium]
MINGLEAEIFGQSLDKARRLIFYLHGGAFVSGSSLTHRHLVLRLAKEAVASALVINYRLAPEFPFPAPLEDCFRAYRWLLEKEYQSARLAIAGDSAGGNLAVALTQKLIKEGYPLPACLILFSPWVDLSCSSPSYEERSRRDPMISRPLALERAKWYAGSKTLNNPEISPLFGDFTNFPPLLIFIGSEEVLYDEALALAQKAIAAGVEVQLLEWRGMFHVWPYFFPFLPEGREACRLAGDFLRLYLSKN